MGCGPSKAVKKKYINDQRWKELATWGKHVGVSSWGEEIVCMDSIHPKLFMGSRLSAQVIIDKKNLMDPTGNIYKADRFCVVCVASEKTCQYCEMSKKFKRYDIQDRHNQSDNFLEIAIQTAHHIRNKLRAGKHVLVHCHSGRNRSALAILVYAGMYTNMTYENALHSIKLNNSSRFPIQSTLQNNQFTSVISSKWNELKSKSSWYEKI